VRKATKGRFKTKQERRAYRGLADLVAAMRLEHNLSQTDLAAQLGTSVSAVSRLESGQHRPNLETLERLGRLFGRIVVVGFEDGTGGRELVTLGERHAQPTAGEAQAAADRIEIRRLVALSDREREAYFIASNRNMLHMLMDARRAG
jgi:transcriptional regulator with XRE-family HTH domain